MSSLELLGRDSQGAWDQERDGRDVQLGAKVDDDDRLTGVELPHQFRLVDAGGPQPS